MKVQILSHTNNPELLIATAAKLCYAGCTIDELKAKQTPEEIEAFIKRLSNMGHESPLEHVSFTFAIEGVSRITEQQLTRHRLASYSIQSGRYVTRDNAEFFVPLAIDNNPVADQIYKEACDRAKVDYAAIVEAIVFELCLQECKIREIPVDADCLTTKSLLKDKLDKVDKQIYRDIHKVAIENARCVFPNSLETRIICTMNARSLLNFFKHRCCFRAQEEIRELAYKMLSLVKEICPTLFANAGAPCKCGICPENSMQCKQLKGKIPTMVEVRQLIKDYYVMN